MNLLNVIQYKKIYLSIGAFLVILSWIFILFFGLKPGIDFSGGVEWQITFEKSGLSNSEISSFLFSSGLTDVKVLKINDKTFLIRTNQINTDNYKNYSALLKDKFGDFKEDSFSNVGPSVGKELKKKATVAVFLVLIGISFYITYAFRKASKPISSWKYGFATLLSLFHDVSLTLGFLSILGEWKGVLIDTNSIVALLLIAGFSVHDTIVVFDRIRENLILNRGKKLNLKEIINFSVKQTLARSINTSLTFVLVLITLLLFGPQSLFYFILTILFGTFFGTYSSIFIASPLLYIGYREEK